MKQGDLVVRKSYGGDVLFRVDLLRRNTAILKGTDYRLLADAPYNDLEVVVDPEATGAAREVRIKMKRFEQQALRLRDERSQRSDRDGALQPQTQQPPYFELPGKVLHLDGDGRYMLKSMRLYDHMRIPARGIHCHESQMPELLRRLLPSLQPDIVVITGHDGVLKHRPQGQLHQLSSYKNSMNFVQAVRVAREYDRNRDSLIVIAGACQSHYEALLQAGANFASSPGRILIHALDPVYIAVKASQTPIRETVSLTDVIHGTISGVNGMGGIETMGKFRVGMPRPKAAQVAPAQQQMQR